MFGPTIIWKPEKVVIDIDTQRGFFLADSRLRIRNHGRVLANIRRVAAWTRLRHIPMISTVQVYCDKDLHGYSCIESKEGQQKISYTLRSRRVSFPASDSTDISRQIFSSYDQVILSKRCPDPFGEPRADRVLTELQADEFILIGVAAEDAVRSTTLGLLARRKNVTVLVDAVGSQNRAQMHVALQHMWAKGAKLVRTEKLVGASHLQGVGFCPCDCCRARRHESGIGCSHTDLRLSPEAEVMSTQDITTVSRKAKSETEIFINCYLDDQARGWPKIRPAQVGRSNPIEHYRLRTQRDLSMFDRYDFAG